MQTQDQFHARPSFALLLIGAPFTGKTGLALQFPDPYICDYDDKLSNAANRTCFEGKKFWFDCPMRKPDGTPVPAVDVWDYSVSCIKQAVASPDIKTIVLDSTTSLNTALTTHIISKGGTGKPLMVGGVPVMDKSMWMPYRDILSRLFMGLRSSGKYIIVVAHTVTVEDDNAPSFKRPSFAGQMRDTAAGLFTDVWECFNKTVIGADGLATPEYWVRSAPRADFPLGNSLDLPAEFKFEWSGFEKRLLKRTAVPVPAPMVPPVAGMPTTPQALQP